MDHQRELEKKKYRNWVRGGLAYKYLKEGIEGFADEVVQQEHTRILRIVSHTSGLTCNQCCLKTLRPIHRCKTDHAGRNKCPWHQTNCNCCHYTQKQQCSNKLCDSIMEEILRSHGSTPPSPYWKNTDIQKWCTAPWEIAKCFINASGYSDKTKAADIDISGLLHVFINNINFQSHLSANINWSDIFKQVLKRRNELFHSPATTMEDAKLDECIDEIIAILDDEKELKERHDAQQAVSKLKQLKQKSFIITTHNEAEVCREALSSITKKSEELNQTIQDAKYDIGTKEKEVIETIESKKKQTLQELRSHSLHDLQERVRQLELDSSNSKQRLTQLESTVDNLDTIRQNHQKQLDYVEGKQDLQKKFSELYQNHYVNTSISPLKLQENDVNIKEVYVAPEMVVDEKPDSATNPREKAQTKPDTRIRQQYREILHSDSRKHKNIYIVGDVGTGKSAFCKMMIQNWCSAITDYSPISANGNKPEDTLNYEESENYHQSSAVNNGNISEMRKFDFLFFIPLQRMSGLSDIAEMIKAIVKSAGLTSTDQIDRIFEQESERCLIIADGLDEWNPPNNTGILPHISSGLPKRDERVNHATIITLSRPSAKGILNLESSECDQKVELSGINIRSVERFIQNYLSKFNRIDISSRFFLKEMEIAKLEHLEKTPLLLQQLLWLYCNGYGIGKCVSDTYSHIINALLRWSQNKEEKCDMQENQMHMQLPGLLRRFPTCEANKQFLLLLARVEFEILTSGIGSVTFGRSYLRQRGVSKEGITALIKWGFLVENTCLDPTQENTQVEFIHKSYLEFFAAVYVSSHYNEHQRSILSKTILQDLFQNCTSAADVLQLSNVLKMICGLSPFLIYDLSKLVSDIARRDESIIRYRNSLPEYKLSRNNNVSFQIQHLIFSCLSECGSNDQPMVALCDVIIELTSDAFLKQIIPDNVISLDVWNISDVEVWRWISRLKQLQYIHIDDSQLPHGEMESVFTLIEAPLKHFALYSVSCKYSKCKGHIIDLSKYDQLRKLEIINCKRVKTPYINTKHLQMMRFDFSSVCSINFLLNASSLTELHIGNPAFEYCEYNKQVNSVVQILRKLRKLRIERAGIMDTALTVTSKMRNLDHIELECVLMDLKTWYSFVDSLRTLQQSVQVHTRDEGHQVEIKEDKRNYVREKPIMFEVMKADWCSFSFRTKKYCIKL
ncbi:uncharacterized protein LOC123548631 [Mercenaria mercenaria]|uniref:uncharacterized protein LOC123548631 n=1 Tax=Mercenaria mercenaria TaxID=6596 RepID=UPI00234F0A7B|nr:uncharacterized protein LOC123548631 [Mercenaria mercenaria]